MTDALQGALTAVMPWSEFTPTQGYAVPAPVFNTPIWNNQNNLTVAPSMSVDPTQTVSANQTVSPSFSYNIPTYNIGAPTGGGSSGGGSGSGGTTPGYGYGNPPARGASVSALGGGATPPTPNDYAQIWAQLAQQRYDQAQAAFNNGTGSGMAVQAALENLRNWQTNASTPALTSQMQFSSGGLAGPLNYALQQGYTQGISPGVVDWFNTSPYSGNQTMMGGGSASSVYGQILGSSSGSSGPLSNYGTGTANDGSSPNGRVLQQYIGDGTNGVTNTGVQYNGTYNPSGGNYLPPTNGVVPNGQTTYYQGSNGVWYPSGSLAVDGYSMMGE